MKVVLFCGGMGLRMREYSDTVPKPMAPIGYQPILWYLMRYYAHYGHTDFILCLGYRGDVIKQYFLTYSEAMSNDFTLSEGGRKITLYDQDISRWNITFVDTGMHANIGQRLMQVREHLDDGEMFMANYSDGLSNLPLDDYLAFVREHDKVASFLAVRPNESFHAVDVSEDGVVSRIAPISRSTLINCGYFVFKPQIFDYMEQGEELVVEPFQRLIKEKQLIGYKYDGFWQCMDTFKDKQDFDAMFARGQTPWIVWKQPNGPNGIKGTGK